MPFALITVGLICVITGARNTYADFGTTLAGDFTGPNNFTYWLAAIGMVGALGYIEELRTFSRYFLALIMISMILATQGGIFTTIQNALKSGPVAPTAAPTGTGATGTANWASAAGTVIGTAVKAAAF